MQTMNKFLNRMLTVFFFWQSPDSTEANPRCMMKTNAAERRIQRLFTANIAASGPAMKAS